MIKKFYMCLLLVSICCGCLTLSSKQSISLKIVKPMSEPTCLTMQPYQCQTDLFSRIGDNSDPAVDFFAIVHNNSEFSILMLAEWCSWGYDNLSIVIKTQDGEYHHLRRRACIWSKNIPFGVMVNSFDSALLPVSLDMRIWENMPLLAPGEKVYVKARLSHVVLTKSKRPIWNDFEKGEDITLESDWYAIQFRSIDGFSPFSD